MTADVVNVEPLVLKVMDRPRLLIVDDDKDTADALEEELARRGFEVRSAYDARDALDAVVEFEPEIALVDFRLGRETGIDLIDQLTLRGPRLLCIVMTAYADLDVAIGAVRHGVYDFFQKPINLDLLEATLGRAYGVVRLKRDKEMAQEALREAHDKLEQRVEERTSELSQEIQHRIEVEEALRNSEARFKDFAEAASDYFWETDENLRFSYFSERFTEVTGVPKERLLGKTRQESGIDVEDEEAYRRHLADLAAHRPFRGFAYPRTHDNGRVVYLSISGDPVFDEAGIFQGYRGSGTDISEHKRMEEELRRARDYLELRVQKRTRELTDEISERKGAEEALRVSEQNYRALFENATAGIGRSRITDGKVLMANRKLARIFGYERVEQFVAEFVFVDHYVVPGQRERLLALYQEGSDKTVEVSFTTRDGSVVTVANQGWVDEKAGHIDFVMTDITERKRAEEALRQSDERLKLSLRSGQIGTFFWNVQDGTHVWDDRMHEIWGLEPGTYQGAMEPDFLDNLHPDDAQRVTEAVRRTLEEDYDYDIDYRIIHPDETTRHVHALATLIRDEQGRPIELIGVCLDITESKRAEEKIKASLEEKDVLLKEIHHRVKNNLQVISSILSLQAGAETDDRSRGVLKESQRRVKVMARIHENLHQTDDLTSINARDYLNTVVGDTIASGGHDAQRISSRLEADDIVIDVDQAVACRQIVSELLSNSLKHAFPDGQSGTIEVSLHRRDEGRTDLTIADDGKGLPEGFDLEQAETLGMRLIHALAMQLIPTA